MNSRLRFGFSGAWPSTVPLNTKMISNDKRGAMPGWIGFICGWRPPRTIAFMIGASARRDTQFLRRLPGRLFRVFHLDDFAHELRRELRVFVCEFDPDGSTIDDSKLM